MSTRESVYSALFALVSGLPGIKYSSRRMKAFPDVGQGDQPALFMVQKSEKSTVVTKMPAVWELRVDLIVYVSTGGNASDVVPSSVLNPINDLVSSALVPPSAIGEQTLGGLVQRCRLDGDIQIVEGVQGDQALSVIPVVVFATEMGYN